MEVTVSILDSRHLSQSELILRKLYTIVQVGTSVQRGSAVRIHNTKFRSGTSENPLVVTVRNSQTETVMYVRNVPMSFVLAGQRPFEDWVAVYPPGDPQNLHFDASQQPKDGCPQLLISISIDESPHDALTKDFGADLSTHSATGPLAARPSFDPLRRSVDSLQVELTKSRESGSSRPSWPPTTPSGGSGGSTGYSAGMDSTVREKELQALRIKESVAAMATAQRRADDMSRAVSDNRRILEKLSEQLRGLEAQLGEQRGATQIIERERDRLLAEDAALLDQVRERDEAIQSLRDNRDGIDREISRALGESKHQQMAMDASTSNFMSQSQTLVGDIDSSRRHVEELSSALRAREAVAQESERRARMARDAAESSRDEERRQARESLDQTQKDLQGFSALLQEEQQRRLRADQAHAEAKALLAALDRDAGDDSETSQAALDLAAQREKLRLINARAEELEGKLDAKRSQIWIMTTTHSEVSTEAKEKELAAIRSESAAADLHKQLAVHRVDADEASAAKEAAEEHVRIAEAELESLRSRVEKAEAALLQRKERQLAEEANLEKDTKHREAELSAALAQVAELQVAHGELDATVSTQRQRQLALDAANARAAVLSEELAEASEQAALKSAGLEDLRTLADKRSCELETLHNSTREHKTRSAALQESHRLSNQAGEIALANLDTTLSITQADFTTAADASGAAALDHAQMQKQHDDEQETLAALVLRVEELTAEDSCHERETLHLDGEHATAVNEFSRQGSLVQETEAKAQASFDALMDTQKAMTLELQQISDWETELKRAPARYEAEVEALATEQEDDRRLHGELQGRLAVLKVECEAYDEDLASHEQAHAMLQSEFGEASAEGDQQVREIESAITLQEALTAEAAEHAAGASTRAAELESRIQSITSEHSRSDALVATARASLASEEAQAREAAASYASRQAAAGATGRELERQRQLVSSLETTANRADEEVADLQVRLDTVQLAAESSQKLAERHAVLLAEHTQDLDLHRRIISEEAAEAEAHREALARQRQGLLQTKGVEISQYIEQVDTLEAERLGLTQQAVRAEMQLRELRENLAEQQSAAADLAQRAQQADDDEKSAAALLRDLRANAVPALAAQAAGLEQSAAEQSVCLAALRREANDSRATVDELSSQLALARARVERESASAGIALDRAASSRASQERAHEELAEQFEQLTADEAELRRREEDASKEAARLGEALLRSREELRAQGGRDPQRQGSKGSAGSDLEVQLQRVSDQLADTLERARRSVTREEAVRVEMQKLKDAVKAGLEKMTHQVEHDDLQFETIKKLGEDKLRFEGEVEILTLGLHDAERQNAFLQRENLLMQQQVEGRYKGSLQDWATEVQGVKVAAEVAKYKEEIGMWKEKAEETKKQTAVELDQLQAQHEETIKGLRERIGVLKREKGRCELMITRHEAMLKRAKDQGPALMGLSVPQRPLQVNHRRRKALLVGTNYVGSHAPLKGCVNDVWALQCLLRHTLRYGEESIRVLVDGIEEGANSACIPTRANIVAGLQWLVEGAQAGDTLLFAFCGYGAQHPRSPSESESYESYLVPCDFAADLSPEATAALQAAEDAASGGGGSQQVPRQVSRQASTGSWFGGLGRPFRDRQQAAAATAKGYRLVSLLEVHDFVCRLPAHCRLTVLMDSCHSVLPAISASSNFGATFPRIDRGRVDYAKLRDFISRPRFLELPVLPICHTPEQLRGTTPAFPRCVLHAFAACKQREWCAEFPIEGTVQGAFAWSFLKALARGHFHCGVYQLLRTQALILADVSQHFKGVAQTPVLQQSQAAGMHDVVLWT